MFELMASTSHTLQRFSYDDAMNSLCRPSLMARQQGHASSSRKTDGSWKRHLRLKTRQKREVLELDDFLQNLLFMFAKKFFMVVQKKQKRTTTPENDVVRATDPLMLWLFFPC